jgi:hypothetical protein
MVESVLEIKHSHELKVSYTMSVFDLKTRSKYIIYLTYYLYKNGRISFRNKKLIIQCLVSVSVAFVLLISTPVCLLFARSFLNKFYYFFVVKKLIIVTNTFSQLY